MSAKNKIIIVGGLLVLLVFLSMICVFIPIIKIDIVGEKKLIVGLGENYKEKGAKAYLTTLFQKENIKVTTHGNVNTDKLGEYLITYKATWKGIEKEKIRVVKVVDNTPPIITLNQNIKVCQKNGLAEIDATAIDNYDGNITDKIGYKFEKNKIYLSVLDSSNNKSEIIKNIEYIDSEHPTIALNGNETIYLNKNENYEELGATARDSCDGDLTNKIQIDGTVNSKVPGTYKIVYKVSDSFGNEVRKIRNIIIYKSETVDINSPKVNDATIYLTFDDGPGQYTEQILKILDKHDVKATFFVTNQFPKYRYLLKEMYKSGHAIGVHTYSHKWTIYESVESYLNDFKKIEEIIFNETGISPKIFRFPGGSSNVVSQKYKKGIMTELSKIMTEKGYVYFDWTFDSGDTSKKDNSANAIINNVKKSLKGEKNYIVLMHDIKKNTLKALPEIIEYAKTLGYEFNYLDENSPTAHFKIVN